MTLNVKFGMFTQSSFHIVIHDLRLLLKLVRGFFCLFQPCFIGIDCTLLSRARYQVITIKFDFIWQKCLLLFASFKSLLFQDFIHFRGILGRRSNNLLHKFLFKPIFNLHLFISLLSTFLADFLSICSYKPKLLKL